MRDQSVLVTGATGFIGRALTQRLIALGAQVTLFLRPHHASKPLPWSPSGVHWGEIQDGEAVARAVEATRPRFVFHLAAVGATEPWVDEDLALAVNLRGTLHLLRALRRLQASGEDVSRVVLAGTAYEYGERRGVEGLDPPNVYAASKVAAWAFARVYHRAYGLPLVVVRPFNTYGPGQRPPALVAAALQAALEGRDFPTTPGEQRRDFIYIDDVVEGFLVAATAPEIEGESLDLGTGISTPIGEVVTRIYELVGGPGCPRIGALPPRPGTLWDLRADARRTTQLTGWQARVGLEQGLPKTVEQARIPLDLYTQERR